LNSVSRLRLRPDKRGIGECSHNEGALMIWYVYVAWFFAGAFLANAIPHIVQGICGNRFQSSRRRPASANPLPSST
jgi:hypothetical protein